MRGIPSRPQRAVQEVPAGDQRGDPTRRLVLRPADTVPEDIIITQPIMHHNLTNITTPLDILIT